MKVLEKGEGWNIEARCTGKGNGDGGCNAKLLVEKDDIYVTTRTDYVGDTDYFYTFCCPQCRVETDIEEKKIPYSVKTKALEKKKHSYIREWR